MAAARSDQEQARTPRQCSGAPAVTSGGVGGSAGGDHSAPAGGVALGVPRPANHEGPVAPEGGSGYVRNQPQEPTA